MISNQLIINGGLRLRPQCTQSRPSHAEMSDSRVLLDNLTSPAVIDFPSDTAYKLPLQLADSVSCELCRLLSVSSVDFMSHSNLYLFHLKAMS
ncbi:hypothetical protein EVAR_45414_1 [Eumeta japonica]|uniref:Uncharacterized protein n=1 Tax=Eumeta variegata TaxID=151549 RepID=A0A4C1WQI0_EUMVA|nr:hypothetical protein EVAR_45414_1 [Eumeta japonica]